MNEHEKAIAQPAVIGSEAVEFTLTHLSPCVPSLEPVDVPLKSTLKNQSTLHSNTSKLRTTADVTKKEGFISPVIRELIVGGGGGRVEHTGVSPDADRILSMLRMSSAAGKSLHSNNSTSTIPSTTSPQDTSTIKPPPGIDIPLASAVQPPHILMQPHIDAAFHQLPSPHLQLFYNNRSSNHSSTFGSTNQYNNHFQRPLPLSFPTTGDTYLNSDVNNGGAMMKLPTTLLFNTSMRAGHSMNGHNQNTTVRSHNTYQDSPSIQSQFGSMTAPLRIHKPHSYHDTYNEQHHLNNNNKSFTTTSKVSRSTGFISGGNKRGGDQPSGTPTGDPTKPFRPNRSLPTGTARNTNGLSSPRGKGDSVHHMNASNNLLRMIQSNKSPKQIPFIPHNAYSVDPITDSLVEPLARDLIPPGLPINRVPVGMWSCIQQSNKLNPNEDEEALGLSGFDRVLYTRSERARRSSCDEYKAVCQEKAFDLKITMPVQIPNGSLVVDVNSGEHYYGQVESKDEQSNVADHILFGRGLKDSKTQSYRDNDDDIDQEIPDYTASLTPSACDIWGSFLRINLGVIYNVRQDQLRIVSETLKQIMAGTLFEEPIEFHANGIYGNKEFQGILQAPEVSPRGVMYMTHLRPKTKQDRDKFISIRQRLKMFANALGFHFGGSLNGLLLNNVSTEYHPLMCVELERNLCSERINNGLIHCEIRSYDKNLASSLKNQIWSPLKDVRGPKMAGGNEIYQNITRDRVTTMVESTEIRLEHDHGYCVDPRWPRELIIARRIACADGPLLFNKAYSADRYARHCFAQSSKHQNIFYRGKFKDKDANEREDTIFKIDECKSLPGSIIKSKLCETSRFNREFTNYLRTEPQAGTGIKPNEPLSPVSAPLPIPHNGPTSNTPPMSNPYIRDIPNNPFFNLVNGGRLATARTRAIGINKTDRTWNVNATEFSPSPRSVYKRKKTQYWKVPKKDISGTGSQRVLKPHRDTMLRNLGVEAFTKVTNNET